MRSQWPCGLRRWSAAVRLLRLWVRIPPGAWKFVCCKCCVLPGRVLCHELITRPEESYRPWCVVVCDLETSWMRSLWPTGHCRAKNKQTWSHNPPGWNLHIHRPYNSYIIVFIAILIRVNFTLNVVYSPMQFWTFKVNVYHLPSIKNCILPTPCTSIYALPMIHRKNANCFLKQHHRQKRSVFIMSQELAKN
jgi:hypothetical protein